MISASIENRSLVGVGFHVSVHVYKDKDLTIDINRRVDGDAVTISLKEGNTTVTLFLNDMGDDFEKAVRIAANRRGHTIRELKEGIDEVTSRVG